MLRIWWYNTIPTPESLIDDKFPIHNILWLTGPYIPTISITIIRQFQSLRSATMNVATSMKLDVVASNLHNLQDNVQGNIKGGFQVWCVLHVRFPPSRGELYSGVLVF